jgi:three-Cys-motif partner protein
VAEGKNAGGRELPEVGPWARDKLGRLREYLTAYSRVLDGSRRKIGWPPHVLYVDAFAGSGVARVRTPTEQGQTDMFAAASAEMRQDAELQQLLSGSPLVALRIAPAFTDLVFLERDDARASALRLELGGDERARVYTDDCNEFLTKDLLPRPAAWWDSTRAIVFLDPFGMQVPWSTIERLGDNASIEIILNLPLGMAVQRLLPVHGQISSSQRRKLDDYFGDPAWHSLVYSTEPGLFDDDLIIKSERAEQRLLDWYARRLEETFGYVAGAFPVRNTRGKVLYHLLWAGHHPTGHRIATSVFSDRPSPR